MRRVLVAAAVSAGLALTACGTSWQVPENLADGEVVKAIPCDHIDEAINAVSTASQEQDTDALQGMGVTEQNKADVEKNLGARKSACTNGSSAQQVLNIPQENPLQTTAQQTCDGALVVSCKSKGQQVFESIPAASRGDENKANTAAALAKELAALPDQPEKLEQAIRLVNALNAYAAAIKEGQAIDTAVGAAGVLAMFQGVTQKDVNVGSHGDHAVDWALNTQEERGNGSFTNHTLKTPEDVSAYLNDTNDPKAKATRERVEQGIRKYGYGDDQVARAMSGAGYIPVQMKEASQILGTSYFKDGKVLIAGTWRQAAPGDVYWLYFASDGKVIPEALVRADCGNSNAVIIRVVRPGMPVAPPVDQPPGEELCPQGNVLHPGAGVCSPPPPPGCKEKGNCPTLPCTNCTNNPKVPNQAPGQGGTGDGGASLNGGVGTQRQTAAPNPDPPKGGQPTPTYQPGPKPAPNPVPSATKAPSPTAPVPTATGAPPPSAAPSQCVNPPGMKVCND